jgi:hypothetical protein
MGVMDAEKFAATAELCAWHGWAYRRVAEMPCPDVVRLDAQRNRTLARLTDESG